MDRVFNPNFQNEGLELLKEKQIMGFSHWYCQMGDKINRLMNITKTNVTMVKDEVMIPLLIYIIMLLWLLC